MGTVGTASVPQAPEAQVAWKQAKTLCAFFVRDIVYRDMYVCLYLYLCMCVCGGLPKCLCLNVAEMVCSFGPRLISKRKVLVGSTVPSTYEI